MGMPHVQRLQRHSQSRPNTNNEGAMKLQTAIGGTIRMVRTNRKLSLRQVTPYISYGHLSDVERGVKAISPELLEEISRGLHLTTPDLLRQVADYMEGQQ